MNKIDEKIFQHFRRRSAEIMDHETFHHFALLVPLMKKNGEYHIVFEVRAQNIRQPGEICFPGGKVDLDDDSHEAAAIREFSEELGVPVHKVAVMGKLDYMITPFKLMLFPFLGIVDEDAVIKKNDAEVKEVLYIPLSKLRKMKPKEHFIYLRVEPEKGFPYHLIPNGENYNWRTGSVTELFYDYNGHVIWGLTARILAHVMEEITKVEEKWTNESKRK